MIIDSKNLKPGWADCAIVLGGSMANSKKLDSDTINRLRKAVDLSKNGYLKRILVAGGASFDYPYVIVSKIMKKFLVSKGIKAKNIFTETDSRDTIGNALFSKLIIQNKKYSNLVLISSSYHISRSLYVFNRVFGDSDYHFIGIEAGDAVLPVFQSLRETFSSIYDTIYLRKFPKKVNVKSKKEVYDLLRTHLKYKKLKIKI